ncbi:MAG: PIG-L deacetylase family protein [Planctomycetota bacterium]
MTTAPHRKVVLAFFAHPDDAEFLCAGALIRLADAGWDVHIATATAGDGGSATLRPEEIAAIRRAEAADSADKLGAVYHCLEEPDVQVVFDRTTNRKAIDLFRRIGPSLVITHPRRDYMLDHEQVHLLARSAAFGYPIPNASTLPVIEGSSVPWLYYADPVEGNDPYTGRPVEPTFLLDVSSVFDRKIEMLACHASQREWLRSHHGMDEYLDAMKRHAAFRGRELGVGQAEAFIQHAGHPFPQSNLLLEILEGA